VPSLLVVLLYFRFGFGLFSRNFERQSDLHALRMQGSSKPLITAFEKISGFNPLVRLLPNWHHFSIQERIDFLLHCEAQPGLMEHHHRKVRLLVGGYLIFFMLLGALLVGWGTQGWKERWALVMGQRLVEHQLARSPQDAQLWFAFGSIAFEREDFGNAEAAYRKSIQLDPDNPDTLNNLAWLYATAPEREYRDPAQALRLARQAAALRPEAPHILDTLAEALFVNGRPQEALETELKALRLAGDRRSFYEKQIQRFRSALRN
jgi:tetratricopeptide (TPR) repeat protein